MTTADLIAMPVLAALVALLWVLRGPISDVLEAHARSVEHVKTSEEREALDMLAYCTTDHEAYLHQIRQAVEIAKMGGIEDGKLEALLALGAVGMLTPYVEKALHAVDIDTRPWAVVREELRGADESR